MRSEASSNRNATRLDFTPARALFGTTVAAERQACGAALDIGIEVSSLSLLQIFTLGMGRSLEPYAKSLEVLANLQGADFTLYEHFIKTVRHLQTREWSRAHLAFLTAL